MNPRIKADWVTALRSTKYRQVRGALREQLPGKHVGYCCLGVLCDVAKEEVAGKWTGNQLTRFNHVINGEMIESGGALSHEFSKYVEVTPSQESTLIGMNDDEKKSFKEIADYIEKNL
jgi:hypothetical protein